MRKLRVFRVQPQAYEKFMNATKDAPNKSEEMRSILETACKESPPGVFPKRKIKADLKAFSVFMSDAEHEMLIQAKIKAGVSKNMFIEAVLSNLKGD